MHAIAKTQVVWTGLMGHPLWVYYERKFATECYNIKEETLVATLC